MSEVELQEKEPQGFLEKWIYGAMKQKLLAFAGLLLLIGVGINSLLRFPIDGLPDISNVQVQVITEATALGPQEVEQLITFPLEIALTGMPKLKQMRSISKYGLSQITVVFEDGTDIYFARQLVNERLKTSESILPAAAEQPVLGPVSTGLGEIFVFSIEGKNYSPLELRTIMDWQVIPRLRSVKGVAEINPMGGFVKQYQVKLDPERMIGYSITPQQVFEALQTNNANSGGGYASNAGGEQTIIRGAGLIVSTSDIGNIIVARTNGTPVYVKDVADVVIGNQLRQGVVTQDGKDNTVIATVLMRAGENANAVVQDVKARVDEIQKELPPDVKLLPVYDRTLLITAAIKTVSLNLFEGALLVTAILLLMLGSVRGAVITAVVIPLSMLAAITGMTIGGVSGNLMSLGAIDFGLLVDGSVVLMENIILRVSHIQPQTPKERFQVIAAASAEFVKPIVFGIGIITIVYFPIFGLSGVEGKLFQPMAFTVILALLASLLITLSLVPILCYFAFSFKLPEERETFIVQALRPPYERAVDGLMGKWVPVAVACTSIFVVTIVTVLPQLGSEFVPNLSEGGVVINVRRPPSASLEEGARQAKIIERIVKEFLEVVTAVSTTGHPELATDTNKSENTDVNITLKPQKYWKTAKTQPQLVKKIEERLKGVLPGVTVAYTQPIQQRVNELLSGDRLDVALRIFGSDIEELDRLAKQAAAIIKTVPGAADVRAEAVKGLPLLNIEVDRQRLAQYGINVREVLDTIEATRAGKVVGTIYEGRQRFSLAVKFNDAAQLDLEDTRRLPVTTKDGQLVQLGSVVNISEGDGLAQISHREAERVITVGMNVRGTDLGTFVGEAQQAVNRQVILPTGYRLVWGGQFENYKSALERLQILVPLSLLLIFAMLYTTFGSLRPGFLIFLNVPFSLVGGLVGLWLRGMPLSVSAGVGFIALFGIAVLNGIVLVSKIRDLESAEGLSAPLAALKGAKERLRPILTTTFVASIGFIPMAIATSAGAEVQQPLATVVIGGLVTCTTFNLFALPVLYPIICGDTSGGDKPSLWQRLRGALSGQPISQPVVSPINLSPGDPSHE